MDKTERVGAPATIHLETDSCAAVVVRVNGKSISVARVETGEQKQDMGADGANSPGCPPVMRAEGILDKIIGKPARYVRVERSDGTIGYRNGSITVTLGQSVSRTRLERPTPVSTTQRGDSSRLNSTDPTDRAMIARIAAHTSWANTSDRSARTAPGRAAARAAMLDRFERQVDPNGTLPPKERAERAASARKAYFQQLARRSRKSRQRAAGDYRR